MIVRIRVLEGSEVTVECNVIEALKKLRFCQG